MVIESIIGNHNKCELGVRQNKNLITVDYVTLSITIDYKKFVFSNIESLEKELQRLNKEYPNAVVWIMGEILD